MALDVGAIHHISLLLMYDQKSRSEGEGRNIRIVLIIIAFFEFEN